MAAADSAVNRADTVAVDSVAANVVDRLATVSNLPKEPERSNHVSRDLWKQRLEAVTSKSY